jgi:hypothetical protein
MHDALAFEANLSEFKSGHCHWITLLDFPFILIDTCAVECGSATPDPVMASSCTVGIHVISTKTK